MVLPRALSRRSRLVGLSTAGKPTRITRSHIEHFAFGVDRAPEIDHPAVDFEIDLVEMPG
jgi:hypothetical protein